MERLHQLMKPLGLIALLLGLSLTAGAQQTLRDSLRMATRALDNDPTSIDLRLRKAGWNMLLEEWENAKADYDIVLRQDENNVAALYFRAYANEQLHRYNFGRADYERLLQIVPMHFEGRLGLALLNEKDKHYTEAMNQLNQLVALFPQKAEAYAARAGVERDHGKNELAEYDFTKALDLQPDNKDYLLSRADLRLKLARTEAAKEDLEQLVKLGTPRPALKDYFLQCR